MGASIVRVVVGVACLAMSACAPTEPVDRNACESASDCATGHCKDGHCAPLPVVAPLQLSPAAVAVTAGASPIEFHLTGGEPGESIEWVLTGAGAISTSGSRATYTPPPTEFVVSALSAVLSASLNAGSRGAVALIAINPGNDSDLYVLPAVAIAQAGGAPVALRVDGTGSLADVRWSLSGPGSLSASLGRQVRYEPPAVDALTTPTEVRVDATQRGGASASVLIRLEPVLPELTLDIVGPEAAAVRVTGPAGFDTTVVGAHVELQQLPVGQYTLTPLPTRARGEVVDALWESDVVQVMARPGERATARVVFSRRPGSGMLWVACFSRGTLTAFDDAQLVSSSAAPALGLAAPNGTQPVAMAFDGDGSVWTLDYDGSLRRYGPSSLAGSGTPVPDVSLTVPGTSLPRGLAFDSDGTLWVASYHGELTGVPRSQQAPSGTTTPRRLTLPAGTGDHRFHGLALDGAGRLWVSDYGTTPALRAFSPVALRAGGTQVPDVEIRGSATRLDTPLGLHFDRHGNLWVAEYRANGGVLRFDARGLLTSGSPSPVFLTVGASAMDMATDRAGDLWVVDESYMLKRFPSSSTVVSGTPTAAWTRQLDAQSFDIQFNLMDR